MVPCRGKLSETRMKPTHMDVERDRSRDRSTYQLHSPGGLDYAPLVNTVVTAVYRTLLAFAAHVFILNW